MVQHKIFVNIMISVCWNYFNSLDSFEKLSISTTWIKEDSQFPLKAIVPNSPLGGCIGWAI